MCASGHAALFYSSPGSQRGDFPAPWSSRVGTGCTQTIVLGLKWVAVAPFELKLGPNESYRRAASVETPPRAQTAQIRAKITVNLPPVAHQAGASLCYGHTIW